MICPKCGRNNEGNICPYCDELEIFDRTDDYLKRREEFETPQNEPEKETESDSPLFSFFKRRWPVLAVIAGAGIAAAVTFTHLPRSFHGSLSYISQGRLINIEKGHAGGAKDTAQLIFSSDGKKYFDKNLPSVLIDNKDLQLRASAADNTGTYFAHTAYNASTGENVLYMWDKNGHVKELYSNSANVDIRYVSPSGRVVFTCTDVLNDQWYTGETGVFICGITQEVVKTLSKSVESFLIYPASDRIICLDKDEVLSSVSIENPENKKIIAREVKGLLGEKSGENDSFHKESGVLNGEAGADLICYRCRSEWIIGSFTGETIVNTGESGGEKAAFAYDRDNKLVYMTDAGVVSKAIVADNGLKPFEALGETVADDDFLWDDHLGVLLFANREGELMSAGTSGTVKLMDGLEQGTLVNVENDGGYMCISGQDICYGKDFGSTAFRLADTGSKTGLTGAAADGDSVFYILKGNLFRVDKKGGEPEDLGVCEKLTVSE